MIAVLVHPWGRNENTIHNKQENIYFLKNNTEVKSIITRIMFYFFLKKPTLFRSWARTHLQSYNSFHLHISSDVVWPGPFCSVCFVLWGKANISHCLWVPLDMGDLVSSWPYINVRQTKWSAYSKKWSFKVYSRQSSNCFFVLTLLAVTVPQSLK